jgi:hypothetical protein
VSVVVAVSLQSCFFLVPSPQRAIKVIEECPEKLELEFLDFSVSVRASEHVVYLTNMLDINHLTFVKTMSCVREVSKRETFSLRLNGRVDLTTVEANVNFYSLKGRSIDDIGALFQYKEQEYHKLSRPDVFSMNVRTEGNRVFRVYGREYVFVCENGAERSIHIEFREVIELIPDLIDPLVEILPVNPPRRPRPTPGPNVTPVQAAPECPPCPNCSSEDKVEGETSRVN